MIAMGLYFAVGVSAAGHSTAAIVIVTFGVAFVGLSLWDLRRRPEEQLRNLIRDAGQDVVAENREALDILAEHDRGS